MAPFFQLAYPPSVGLIADALQNAQTEQSDGAKCVNCNSDEVKTQYTSELDNLGEEDQFNSVADRATWRKPPNFLSYFSSTWVEPWDESRYRHVRKLQDAARNCGYVEEMRDVVHDRPVAVKKMPNEWVCDSAESFQEKHPTETEQPWVDIGCTKWLNDVSYPFVCELNGVYRNLQTTFVVSELATEGDLFSWCQTVKVVPGYRREQIIRPVALQLFEAIRLLHELQVAHRDLSLENVLLSKQHFLSNQSDVEAACLKVIDFSMIVTRRYIQQPVCAKPSYQAPETHTGETCDSFLTDAFAVGVILYGLLCKDYPWVSTKPGKCKLFSYVQTKGFRAYLRKQRIQGQPGHVEDHLSPEAIDLLEGLLSVDPNKRLTLGESCFGPQRRSVFDMAWLGKAPVPGG